MPECLPAWVDHPSTPEWVKAPKYHALNAADVLEVQRGIASKRTIDQRIANRRHYANPRAEQWRATVATLEKQFDMGTGAAGAVMP